eukprot:1420157-Amphidinium_carterae.1
MFVSTHDAPPVFDGDPESYREWRRRAELWSLGTRLESIKHGPKLLSVLSGSAWETCKHLTPASVAKDDGVAEVFAVLDGVYGDPRDVMVVEAADAALYGTIRQAQEDIVSFMTRLDAQMRKLETLGTLTLPPEIKGFILAKQAGLNTQEVRELITLTGGDIGYDAVRKHLRRLLYDFSKTEKKRGAGRGVFVASAAPAEEAQEWDYEEQWSYDTAEPSWGDEEAATAEDGEWSEDEAEAVLAAWHDAKQRMASKRTNRGFYPSSKGKFGGKGSKKGGKAVLNIQDIKDKSRCRRCGKIGHWARECPLNQGSKDGKGKGKGTYTAQAMAEDEEVVNQSAVFPQQGAFFVADSEGVGPWHAARSSLDHYSESALVVLDEWPSSTHAASAYIERFARSARSPNLSHRRGLGIDCGSWVSPVAFDLRIRNAEESRGLDNLSNT